MYGPEPLTEIESTFLLTNNNNSNTLVFQEDNLKLELCLKDVIDLEDFHKLLKNKEKKIIIHSTLMLNKVEYQGLRKVINKGENIAVSLGGRRIEITPEGKKVLLSTIEMLRSKL